MLSRLPAKAENYYVKHHAYGQVMGKLTTDALNSKSKYTDFLSTIGFVVIFFNIFKYVLGKQTNKKTEATRKALSFT